MKSLAIACSAALAFLIAPAAAEEFALDGAWSERFAAANVENGKRQFGQCRACHTLDEGGRSMAGPNLWNVFGAASGGKSGFRYSADLKDGAIMWTPDTLDAYLKNPRSVAPKTYMAFRGVMDETKRTDLMAYIYQETRPADGE
ncbi:MAG: c-type cytochrome [Pseudomonadota bacterium]